MFLLCTEMTQREGSLHEGSRWTDEVIQNGNRDNIWVDVPIICCKPQQFTHAYSGYPTYTPGDTCNRNPVRTLPNLFFPWAPPCCSVEAFFPHILINTRCKKQISDNCWSWQPLCKLLSMAVLVLSCSYLQQPLCFNHGPLAEIVN